MKIFLASTFRTEKDKKRIDEIENLLKENNLEVYNSQSLGQQYGATEKMEIYKMIEKIKEKINKSDVLIAITKKTTPGTMMEICYAHENNIPVIALIKNADEYIMNSSWMKYNAKFVKNEEELIEELKKLM